MKPSVLYPLLGLALAGCAGDFPKNMPLVFGESITLGIGVGTSAADQGAEFTLGFKSRDVAVIPVTAYDKDSKPVQALATVTEIRKDQVVTETEDGKTTVTTTPEIKTINNDSYAVLGQFGSTADGSGRRVGLGKFFATGNAAQQLSAGFAECLKRDKCGSAQAGDGK